MRVLIDSNIYLSYLLFPRRKSPVSKIITAGFQKRFTLLLPEAVLEEFAAKVSQKPYLSSRITTQELHEFAALLSVVAEKIPKIETPLPAVTRDPKDDYLLAYALVGEADYLVTGDDDLLSLGQAEGVMIITPRALWEQLQERT